MKQNSMLIILASSVILCLECIIKYFAIFPHFWTLIAVNPSFFSLNTRSGVTSKAQVWFPFNSCIVFLCSSSLCSLYHASPGSSPDACDFSFALLLWTMLLCVAGLHFSINLSLMAKHLGAKSQFALVLSFQGYLFKQIALERWRQSLAYGLIYFHSLIIKMEASAS